MNWCSYGRIIKTLRYLVCADIFTSDFRNSEVSRIGAICSLHCCKSYLFVPVLVFQYCTYSKLMQHARVSVLVVCNTDNISTFLDLSKITPVMSNLEGHSIQGWFRTLEGSEELLIFRV